MKLRERIARFLRTVAEWLSPVSVPLDELSTVKRIDPFCQLVDVIYEDESEKIELKSIVRREHSKDKINRAFKLYLVRHPSATMEEFNELDVAKRRDLMEAANNA